MKNGIESKIDIARIRDEYENREHRFAGSTRYSWFNLANLFAIHHRQRKVLSILGRLGLTNISNLCVLEIGCGSGEVLREFLTFGVFPSNLYGVDVLGNRLIDARHSLPGSNFSITDAQSLPFPSHCFDIVMQFTAISSILDSTVRSNVCRDMLRVLRKEGLILSYDFWLNPTNPQTYGIRPAEIRRLFPDCHYEFHRVTLAPPIARRLVPVSWQLSTFLEKLIIFNSHYLSVIQPL